MEIFFEIKEGDLLMESSLIYESKYIFPEPDPGYADTSLMLNMLNIEIDLDGRLLFVDGYCSHDFWKLTNSRPPHCEQGIVVAKADKPFVAGVAVEINNRDVDLWPEYINPDTGWLCVGKSQNNNNSRAVEFANDSIAVINDDKKLTSLWLKISNDLPDYKWK